MAITKRGFIISIEGMEGAGKTTLCTFLGEKLEALGKKIVIVREPGGVPIAEQIREVVLSPRNENMGVYTEVLLFQAARAQLYHEIVLPALEKGTIVLMDRTRDSSTVYQGIVRKMGVKLIETLNDISTQDTFPVLTFLLDTNAEEGMRRRAALGKLDRIEREGVPLQKKVVKAYQEVAKQNDHNRWVVIDANKPIEQVQEEVWGVVEKRLFSHLQALPTSM